MRRPLIGGKNFQPSIGQGEQAQGAVIGGLLREVVFCVCFLEGDEGEWVCEKFLVLMCEKMLFMGKKSVQTKTMKGSYV
jgi:thymidine phosphorylase